MTIRLAEQVAAWERPSVLVMGDAIWDIDVHGRTTHYATEAPGCPTFVHGATVERGGGALAVAEMLRALGATVITTTGETSVKTRYLVEGRQVFRVDKDVARPASTTSESSLEASDEWLAKALEWADVALVSDYGKGYCTPRRLKSLLDGAAKNRIPCLVDPASGVDWDRYCGATAIKATSREHESALGIPPGLQVVITYGEFGCQWGEGGRFYEERPRVAVDPTGCGDAFLAAMAVGLFNGMDWPDLLKVCNHVGGLKVERRGASPVHRGEIILDLLHGEKIVPGSLIGTVAAEHRRQDKQIVVTNGCFDGLHAGHHALMNLAGAEGDVLIVLVDDDARVRGLKGPGRPRVPLAYRQQMLADLTCVDYVVPFGGDELLPLIEAIQPGKLVKGGDYAGRDITGADAVRAYGGKVMLIDRIPGFASSSEAS